jgi:hypothetical protein
MNEIEPDLVGIAERLWRERPLPRASFRGNLERDLLGQPRPPRLLRLLITAYAASGACLLAVAAVGVVGAGPFA